MNKNSWTTTFGLGVLLATSTAYAGGYADGYGETVEKAVASARDGAAKAVKSRGKGCVGPGKSGEQELKYLGQEKGLYHFQAFYNHTNGACGKQKTFAEVRKEFGV